MRRHNYHRNVYGALLIRLLIALLFFSLSRSLFYFFNYQYFSELDMYGLLLAFMAGIRFDITAVIILNAPYILMNVVPLPLRTNKLWQRISNVFFYAVNIFGFALNTIDTVYFRFTSKRMTADIFSFVRTGEEDFISLVPRFIADFAWEILAWLVLVVIFVFFAARIKTTAKKVKLKLRFYILNSIYFLLAGTMAIIGIRGGFQLRPITIIDAGKYISAKNVSLVLNTPFTIIKSFGHTGLQEAIYYDDGDVLSEIFTPVHDPPDSDTTSFKPYNVVVLIMESFSTEYIGALNGIENGISYTPHLDSIIQNSLGFRAYANGKQSMEALPAIVAGLPSLTTRPYITSAYGSNQINSLASLLGDKGYSSAFFHGGRNGTMGFESFTDIAGFENYYGKDQYDNDEDFDGNWGIYDEAYFEYFRHHLDTMSRPFMVSFFSLSSHHPYAVPQKYEDKFNKGTMDIHESIMYADFALGKFFREARRSDWFDSTLFVITADHTSLAYEPLYRSREGIYAVPLVFYMPGKILPEVNTEIAQQTDILPSVLGLMDFNKAFIAFGNNLFDSTSHRFSINHLDGTYQLMKDGWSLQYDGKDALKLEPLTLRHADTTGISYEDALKELEPFLKAFIQQYNHRLIGNKLTISPKDG